MNIKRLLEMIEESFGSNAVKTIKDYVIKETDNRMKSMNDDMEDMIEAYKTDVIKARIEEHKRRCQACGSVSCCLRIVELEEQLRKGLK